VETDADREAEMETEKEEERQARLVSDLPLLEPRAPGHPASCPWPALYCQLEPSPRRLALTAEQCAAL
jgi:hypothetical protein